jgi:glycosyltransferase involved in cell wall biosynthesis
MIFGGYPDEFVGWARPAAAAGERLARSDDVDAIMSYCPPETNHLVARRLARRLGLPWVPFFGDLYGFLDPPLPPLSAEGFARRAWHRWCLAPAAACAGVSPAMVDYLARAYRKPAHLIHTGFDPGDFAGPDPYPTEAGERLVVSHVGSVYPGDQRPEIFFDGLDRLLAQRPELEKRLAVRFVGSKCDDALRAMLEGRPASRVCTLHPRVDPATALEMVRSSDALLAFTCTAHRDRYGTLSYPTKIFEAFGARRPILAVPADGDWVDTLLTRTAGGTSARDADDVASTLLDWLRSRERDGRVPYYGRQAELSEFTRKRQAERLAALLDAVSRR